MPMCGPQHDHYYRTRLVGSSLHGVQSVCNNTLINHYRGIPYAQIHGRFQPSKSIDAWSNKELDCTRFG